MKTQKSKRLLSLFLAALMCVTTLVGFGTIAYAAEKTDEVCLISFPRDGDANYDGEWAHNSFNFMNGWSSGSPAIPPSALWVRMRAISVTALNPAFRRIRATVIRKRRGFLEQLPLVLQSHHFAGRY